MYCKKTILFLLLLSVSAPLISLPAEAAPKKPAAKAKAKPKAKPKTAPKKPAAKAPVKPVVKAPVDPTKTGVHITPVTRNANDSKTKLPLAKDGKALLPIVISATASDSTKLAAAELKKYLDQISGASFEIKTGAGENGIVLGTIAEFPNPALKAPLEIKNTFDGKEAYAIRTSAKGVLIIGATDLGTSHGAYRFLEEIGCRWFFPDATDNWQVIPKIKDLKFARDITDRPAFLSRSIWYAWWIFGDPLHPASTPETPRSAAGDYGDWKRRNAMAESFVSNTGHAYDTIIREKAAEFEKHPEYYALVKQADGTMKRQGNQLEIGNPALRKLVADWAVDYFKKNPTANMVSVDPADGGGVSESPESAKLGTASDNSFFLANEVARAVEKAYPGQNKMVGMYAYNWHSDPPPFALEPNVYIQLTMGFNSGKLSLDQLFEEWPKKAKNLGFYDYYSTWRWDFDNWPGGRVGNKGYAPAMIRRFQKANAESKAYATSISAESSNNWGVNGRGYYLANKLMWNPQLDEEAILQDFYDKAFGPAADEMKDYFDLQDNVPPMSPGVAGQLFRRLAKAREAAKNDPAVMRRLNDITNYLRYYDLNYRPGGDAARTLEIQTLMYRNRYSYMNHWEAFRQDSIKDNGAADFPRPWKVDDKPITPEETEAWFQDGLKAYPELKIPKLVTYSKELVPVNVSLPGGDAKQVDYASPSIQGGQQEIMFYSLKGEPIRATLLSFAMYGGPKHAWELREENGKVLAEGKPQGTGDGAVTELKVPVPKPGRYILKYTDGSGSLYQFKVPASQPFAYQLDKLNGSTSLYGSTPDLYFYVPKGTKEINYYFARTPWSNSGPHNVIAPDGSVQASFDIGADYVSVPVPEGMDGKPWRMGSIPGKQGFGLGYFHFFNVPDVMAPSPAMMLLPKDLVAKDGLKPVK